MLIIFTENKKSAIWPSVKPFKDYYVNNFHVEYVTCINSHVVPTIMFLSLQNFMKNYWRQVFLLSLISGYYILSPMFILYRFMVKFINVLFHSIKKTVFNPLEKRNFMINYVQSFVHDPLNTVSNEETFLQDFKILIKYFFSTTWIVMLSAGSSTTHWGVSRREF